MIAYVFVGFYDADGNFLFHRTTQFAHAYACVKDVEARLLDGNIMAVTYSNRTGHPICDKYADIKPDLSFL